MKEIDVAQLLADLPRLTAAQCRERAVRMLAATQRLHDEGDSKSAALQAQAATTWATLALSCAPTAIRAPKGLQLPGDPPDREHECCHNSQRLPSARLLAAGDPEPQVNPGALYVDPSGTGARYLLRIDGEGDREWLWCDSLANAEATMRDAGTWATAMGCGILRVREATEREEVEFREGTGGVALDLTRRLLNALSEQANGAGHAVVAQWLADCADRAHLAYNTQQWPAPPTAESPNLHAEYGAEAALRRAAEMAPEASDGVPWRQWLLDCAAAGIGPGGPAWPEPPRRTGAGDILTVRVERSREDLQRLTLDTLGRLRTEVNAIIAERVRATAAGPTDVLGTPRGGADERWRAGTGGGAAQWNG